MKRSFSIAAGLAGTLLALALVAGAYLAVRPASPSLEAAVLDRNPDDIRKLLRLGADPYETAPLRLRRRPATGPVFGRAILCPDTAVAEAFLNHGANSRRPMTFTYLDGQEPQTETLLPMQVAAQTRGRMVRLLKAHGAGVNEKLPGGDTPLNDCVRYGNLGLVRVFLEEGAPVNGIGAGGMTPLMVAADTSSLRFPSWRGQILEALLDAGANPNVRDDLGRTAMHYIVQHNHKPLIRILAERGADIDVLDNENTSPAGLAVSNRKRAAYLYLVEELGARWGMPDPSRRSPPRQ